MTAPEPHQPATDALDFTFEAAERVANLTSKPVSGSMDRDDTELGRQSQITGDPAARGAALEEVRCCCGSTFVAMHIHRHGQVPSARCRTCTRI